MSMSPTASPLSHVLTYQAAPRPIPSALSPRPILITLLAFAHINLCWQISRAMLLPLCDGTTAITTSWCAAAWIPGAAVMGRLGLLAGLPLLLLASTLAGWLLLTTVERAVATRRLHLMSPRTLAAAFVWLCWLPLPTGLTFIWQFRTWALFQS